MTKIELLVNIANIANLSNIIKIHTDIATPYRTTYIKAISNAKLNSVPIASILLMFKDDTWCYLTMIGEHHIAFNVYNHDRMSQFKSKLFNLSNELDDLMQALRNSTSQDD